jgi:adenylyltransferase/sulfurtransferase
MEPVFSSEAVERYRRHFALAGFGPERQAGLQAATVLVIGAGGLGCPALLYLAAAGVGRIVLLDPDRVEVSNLQRQVLFETGDVGQPKADAAERRLRALNPLLRVEAHAERFVRANARELVRTADVVVDGSDNFATRYLVNDACVLENRPWVYGAVQGFEGQASVFNWQGGPTYRCLFPQPPEPGTVLNCAEAGVLGVLPGMIGIVQATETIKLLTGLGEPLSGRLWLYDALSQRVQTVALATDPKSRQITDLPPDGYGEVCKTGRADSDAPPEEIEAADLRQMLVGGEHLQIIDVREGWERATGSIKPSVHVALGLLETGDAEPLLAALDPAIPTVVYCAGGVRSLRAARILRESHRFREALSLRGGYHSWILRRPSAGA